MPSSDYLVEVQLSTCCSSTRWNTRFTCSHYYKNNFARHCPNIKGGGHKIQLSHKISEDFRRQTFYFRRRSQLTVSQNAFLEVDILFIEEVRIARLVKSIYGGGQKMIASKNRFMEVGLLRSPPPKMEAIFGGGHLKRPAYVNVGEPQNSWGKPILAREQGQSIYTRTKTLAHLSVTSLHFSSHARGASPFLPHFSALCVPMVGSTHNDGGWSKSHAGSTSSGWNVVLCG